MRVLRELNQGRHFVKLELALYQIKVRARIVSDKRRQRIQLSLSVRIQESYAVF